MCHGACFLVFLFERVKYLSEFLSQSRIPNSLDGDTSHRRRKILNGGGGGGGAGGGSEYWGGGANFSLAEN